MRMKTEVGSLKRILGHPGDNRKPQITENGFCYKGSILNGKFKFDLNCCYRLHTAIIHGFHICFSRHLRQEQERAQKICDSLRCSHMTTILSFCCREPWNAQPTCLARNGGEIRWGLSSLDLFLESGLLFSGKAIGGVRRSY